jgi:hypothetical protein
VKIGAVESGVESGCERKLRTNVNNSSTSREEKAGQKENKTSSNLARLRERTGSHDTTGTSNKKGE